MIRAGAPLIGLNPAIVFALSQRAVQGIAGFITIWLVASHLSVDQQGFYYTFASLIALQIFFELGLGFVIAQFVSHEFAHLTWDKTGLNGESEAGGRLRKLIVLSLKWYSAAALIMCVVVVTAGILFFQHSPNSPNVNWLAPWIALVILTAINLLTVPLYALVEGSGQVAEFYKFRLVQTVISALSVWLALTAGAGLWATAVSALSNLVVGAVWLAVTQRRFLSAIYKTPRGAGSVSWKNDLWPMQWRIALSWMSGYLLSQLFTPLLFHYQGPETAGRMGITLAVTTMVGLAAITWINVQLPSFGRMIAKHDWANLDQSFRRALTASSAIFVVLALMMSILSYMLPYTRLAGRFLPVTEIILLFCAGILNHFTASFALYLRAHKKEPFLILSLIGAALMACVALLAAKNYGSSGLVLGIFLVHLIFGFPTALITWTILKKRWHS